MASRALKIFIFALGVSLLAGCARERVPAITLVGESNLSSGIVQKLQSAGKVKTLKALVDAELAYRGQKKRFDLAIALVAPDTLRIDFLDQLAGTVATAVYTPDSAIYVTFEGIDFYEGEKAIHLFQKKTGLRWTIEDIVKILAGTAPVALDLKGRYKKDQDGRYWIRDGESSVAGGEDSLDYLELDKGRVFAEIGFKNYKKEKGILYPAHIDVRFARAGMILAIDYKSVELNEKIDSSMFEVQ